MERNVKIGLVIIVILTGVLLWQIYKLPEGEMVLPEAHPGDVSSCDEINAFFQCDEDKWIDTIFYNCDDEENYADLFLSDGREIRVYQAVSASGARYLSQDGLIEFWNKGNNCFINENEEAIFENCLEERFFPLDEEGVDEIIAVGESTIIELDENPTTGYTWRYVLDEEGIVEIISDEYRENEHPEEMVGVGGTRELTVKGLSQGMATINLEYYRQGDPEEIDQEMEIVIKVE